MRKTLGISLAGLSSACSLTSFVDVKLLDCDEQTQADCNEAICEALNDREHIDSDGACEIYQYQPGGGCALRLRDWDGDGFVATECADDPRKADCDDLLLTTYPGADESCNGRDDDCDGLIDEGRFVDPSPEVATRSFGHELAAFSYSVDAPAIALTTAPRASALVLGSEVSHDLVPKHYAGTFEYEDPLDLTMGCPGSEPGGQPELCRNFAELAAAPSRDGWLMAAVDTDGCADGLVRVGYLDSGADSFVIRGPDARSNLLRGVDVDPEDSRDCTGASSPQEQLGATQLSLAVAATADRPEHKGLLTWVGDSVQFDRRDACGLDGEGVARDANLFVLGLYDELWEGRRWVNGANDGVPSSLGLTRAGGPAAVVPLDSSAFLALFSEASSGQIAVRRIGVPDSPAYVAEQGPRTTDELSVSDATLLEGTVGADQLAAAAGRRSDRVCGGPGLEVGVTYLDHCGGSDSVRHFVVVGIPDSGAPCLMHGPLALGPAAPNRPEVSAAVRHVAKGLLREGATYQGTTVTAQNAGGFVIAWQAMLASTPSLVVTRVLDLDGGVMLDPVTGGAEQALIAADGLQPALFELAEGGALRLAYRRSASELAIQELGCKE